MTSGEGFVRRKTLSARNQATMATVVDYGESGRLTLDEPARHGGTGRGPSPLQAVLAALCGCEAVTFRRTATEMGLHYASLDFEAAFTIDIRGRQGDRSVRPHFQTVRVRAVVTTGEPMEALASMGSPVVTTARTRTVWKCGRTDRSPWRPRMSMVNAASKSRLA